MDRDEVNPRLILTLKLQAGNTAKATNEIVPNDNLPTVDNVTTCSQLSTTDKTLDKTDNGPSDVVHMMTSPKPKKLGKRCNSTENLTNHEEGQEQDRDQDQALEQMMVNHNQQRMETDYDASLLNMRVRSGRLTMDEDVRIEEDKNDTLIERIGEAIYDFFKWKL